MNFRSLPLRPVLAVAFAVSILLSAARAADPDLKAPLPVDPTIKMSTLPNGMNYWIRAHKTPPGKVSIYLHVGSGSINEEDDQRGLAHFLEHMAFNGSANFPAGTLVKYFESIGLRFGQHQNAFTSFDQTTYSITLPNTTDETIGKGLQCLADFAFRMSLDTAEIDRERGVILEESRARKGASQRVIDQMLPILAPGSRLAERMPIGKEDVIKAVDRERFTRYYTKWYRPDDTTLLIVGDIDPAAIEKLVAENFKDWKQAEPAKNEDPGVKPYTASRSALIADPELPETDVSVINVRPLEPLLSVGDYRARLIENLGTWIVNRRLAELVEKGAAPFQSASVSVSPFLNVCTYINAQATGKPEQWESMQAVLLQELKRAREHGFLPQEFEDAKKATLSSAEQSARTEATWDARAFLGRMNNAVAQNQKPMSEAQRLELLKAVVPGVQLEEVAAAFKKNFAPGARLLLVTMPDKEGIQKPGEKAIAEAAEKAENAAVQALAAKERPKSLLEKEPEAGTVVKSAEEQDLKIQSVTLSNGVRVHLRQMDFKKDQVLAYISIAGGAIRETDATRGISDVAGLAFAQAATGKFSSTLIREMLTGKNVAVGGGSGEDVFSLSVSGSPADLEEGFRLAHLLLTEGRIEESALKVWKETMAQELERRKSSVETQMMERVRVLLANDDPRFRVLTAQQIEKLTLPDAQQWLDDNLRRGPIEATIVGDMDRARALDLAQKYLGSLPGREVSDSGLDNLRKLKKKKGPLEELLEVETITPRAVVLVGWRGADWKQVKERRILQLAAQILTSRLHQEIREKRSLTYSIGCMAQPGRVYEGSGVFASYFTADPAKAAEAARLTREMMEKFAEEGPTEDEMATVRKQIKNQLETTLKEPSFWAGVLSDLDYRGTKLSDVKEVMEKMTTYTREEMMKVVKKYVNEKSRIQVIALPKKKTAAAEPAKQPAVQEAQR